MSHADLINLWPSLAEFADDLGVPYVTAKAMRRRSSVPASHWMRMVAVASEKGFSGVTLEALALHASQKTVEAAE